MAGTSKDVKVYLNDERLKIKGFKQYIKLYLNSAAVSAAENSVGAAQVKQSVVYERISDRWEVSFVNDAVFPACQGGPHNNTIMGITTTLLDTGVSGTRQASVYAVLVCKTGGGS